MLPLHTLINQTYQIEIDLCLIALIHICSNWTNVNKCNVIIIQPQDLRGLAVAMFHFQARYSSEKLRPNRSIGGLFLAKNESRLTACCCRNFDRPNIAFLILFVRRSGIPKPRRWLLGWAIPLADVGFVYTYGYSGAGLDLTPQATHIFNELPAWTACLFWCYRRLTSPCGVAISDTIDTIN